MKPFTPSSLFSGPLIVSGGCIADIAEQTLEAGMAGLTAFGHAFIANPHLPRRLAVRAPLTPAAVNMAARTT